MEKEISRILTMVEKGTLSEDEATKIIQLLETENPAPEEEHIENTNSVILEIRDLTKTYQAAGGNVHALDGVTFNLYEGELLSVMGTSGSGKSTLLNIVGAMDQPTFGEVRLNGQFDEVMFKEPEATVYRRNNIGFIFQAFNLLKDLTVEENIALPLILQNQKNDEVEKKVNEMLTITGLEKWRTHRPVELSGGQQQRVAIGRALINTPPIVLADELTGNLDFNTSTEILNTLLKMKEQFNQSIILVTHDPSVAAYADRVLFFHDGKIVDEYACQNNEGDLDLILRKFKRIMRRVA